MHFLLKINIFLCFVFLQHGNITDSLRKALSSAEEGNKKQILLALAEAYAKQNPDSALLYVNDYLKEAVTVEEKASAYKVYGTIYLVKRNPDSSIHYNRKALELLETVSEEPAETNILHYKLYNNLGVAHKLKGDFKTALKFYLRALRTARNLNDKEKIGKTYNNMAIIYLRQGNIPKSMEYYLDALSIYEELKDTSKIAKNYLELAKVYLISKDYQKAVEYYKKVLSFEHPVVEKLKPQIYFGLGKAYRFLYATEGDEEMISQAVEYLKEAMAIDPKFSVSVYRELALIYGNLKEYEKALEYALKALSEDRKRKNLPILAQDYLIIGSTFFNLEEPEKAEHYLKEAEKIASKIGDKSLLKDVYAYLSMVYKSKGDYKNAFEYSYKQNIILQELAIQEVNKVVARYEAQYEIEKKEKEFQLWQLQAEAEKKRQKIILYSVVSGLLMVVLIAFLIYRSLRQTKHANAVISRQKSLLERQHAVLEEKNKAIMESISYAKRIQNSLLAQSLEDFNKSFSEKFLIFLPRDIVSGDFYWVYSPDTEHVVFAVGDCTGHGVPAALVGVLSIQLLNEIIIDQGILKTNEILELLREKIMTALGHNAGAHSQKDGLDLSLCVFNKKTKELFFSGAYNPVYIVRNTRENPEEFAVESYIPNEFSKKKQTIKKYPYEDYLLLEVKGDSQPIGIYHREPQPFSYYKILLNEGDSLYLFSDGFADQFGGPKKRKFTYGRFKRLILSAQQYSIEKQKEFLLSTLYKWQGKLEQVDDITLMGIKIT